MSLFFVFMYGSILYVMIAGLQCIPMLPALSYCKVLVSVVLCKFSTAFIFKKYLVIRLGVENFLERDVLLLFLSFADFLLVVFF